MTCSALRIELNRLPVSRCMLMMRFPTWQFALFLHLGPCQQFVSRCSAAQASLTESASVTTYFWRNSTICICVMPFFGRNRRSTKLDSPGTCDCECRAMHTKRFLVIGFGFLAI